MTSTFREKKEKQILISVILIVATFTLCNSFESILFILAHQGCLSSLDIFWDYLRPTANFLMVLNSSVNSLILGICNKTFRTKFVDVFCKCCKETSGKTVHKPGVFSYNKETDTTSLTFPDGRTVTLIEPKHIWEFKWLLCPLYLDLIDFKFSPNLFICTLYPKPLYLC